MNRTECIAQIKNLIPDENVRSFVFNSENLRERNFLTDKSNILVYFSNVLVLSCGIVYTRFIEWKIKKKPSEHFDDFTNSMIRLYNSLEKAYDDTILSFEFIDNLILNLQIDYSLKLDIDSYMNFFIRLNLDNNYFKFNDKFSKYLYEIQKKRISTRYMNEDIAYEHLCSFLEMFPYLNRIKLKYVPLENIYINHVLKSDLKTITIELHDSKQDEEYNKEMNFHYFLINDGYSNYFLEKMNLYDDKFGENNKQKHQIIYLEYFEINWTKRIEIALTNTHDLQQFIQKKYIQIYETAIEDFLLYFNITKYHVENSMDNYFFKDFFSFNNLYLKNFALIISDCLNVPIKNTLLNTYQIKYKNIFNLLEVRSLTDNVTNNYDWDALLTILFLEEGIYKVLMTILEIDDIYQDVKDKFSLRFSDLYKRISKKTELMIKNPTYILLPSDLGSKKKVMSCKANALITLASELLSPNQLREYHSLLPSSMDFRIENLMNVYNSRRSHQEKINFFIESSSQISKMLLVFYESFLEYLKALQDIDFGINQYSLLLDKIDIESYKKKAIDIFVREVNTRKKIYAKSDYNSQENFIVNAKNMIHKIFQQLLDFNHKCCNANSIENKTIRRALGKNILIDENDLELITRRFSEFLERIEYTNLFDQKHVDDLYRITDNYFHYLQFGSFEPNGEYDPQKAAYPLMGTYNNGIVSRDGYLSSYFIIDMPKENEKKIKVLSDDSFQFGEEYFCIPNLNRIARLSKNEEELWVSPIILNYKYFSQNYFAIYSRDKHNEKDYPKISELVYNTDVYVYSSLFGSLENAKKVLPILFNTPRNMFSIDKYVTVKQDDIVIAVGSIYNQTSWDRNLVLSAMKKANVEVPESFDKACAYFEDTYNDLNGKNKIMVCDICVDEKHRNKGVGKFLLMNIIKTARGNGRDLLITVYANNYAAINLYKSLDFIEYERFLDDRGINRPQEVCIKMIRFSDI